MNGARLKSVIYERGLKQRFIAEQAGLDEKKISAIINGRRKLSAEEAERLAAALSMTISEFFEVI